MTKRSMSQSWKQSKPEKIDGTWRIRRHDGELIGWYASMALAQRIIDTAPYLH